MRYLFNFFLSFFLFYLKCFGSTDNQDRRWSTFLRASSTCVLFISVMQTANGAQFLNITFLLVLFTTAPAAAVFGTVIVPLTSMHALL